MFIFDTIDCTVDVTVAPTAAIDDVMGSADAVAVVGLEWGHSIGAVVAMANFATLNAGCGRVLAPSLGRSG